MCGQIRGISKRFHTELEFGRQTKTDQKIHWPTCGECKNALGLHSALPENAGCDSNQPQSRTKQLALYDRIVQTLYRALLLNLDLNALAVCLSADNVSNLVCVDWMCLTAQADIQIDIKPTKASPFELNLYGAKKSITEGSLIKAYSKFF